MKSVKTFFYIIAVFFSFVLVSCHPTDESDFCSYHKIYYFLNGGINSPLNKTECIASDGLVVLYPPTRSGYTFAGWYLNPKFSDQEVICINSEAFSDDMDIYLYAKWMAPSEVRRINYVLNGGVNNPLNRSTFSANETAFMLYSPTKSGYNFQGWYEEPEFINRVSYVYPRNLAGDYTIYARWR